MSESDPNPENNKKRDIQPGEDPELDAKFGTGTQSRVHDEALETIRKEMGVTPESRLQATKIRFKKDEDKMNWLSTKKGIEQSTAEEYLDSLDQESFLALTREYQSDKFTGKF